MKSLLILSAVLSTIALAGIQLPATRAASCFSVMTEVALREANTADAVATFRRLHAKIGVDGWQSRGFGPVQLGKNFRDPLAYLRARGRLDNIRKDFTTGHQWAADNGVQVRGVEIVGKENITNALAALEATRSALNETQSGKLASTTINITGVVTSLAWLGVLLSIDSYRDPDLLALDTMLSMGVSTALAIRDISKFSYHFDRRFSASLAQIRQRLSAGSEDDWYFFGDTVRVYRLVVSGKPLDPEAVDLQDTVDLIPSVMELPVRSIVPKIFAGTSETCLLSTDMALMSGPKPRLALLVRTYPKPPAYPVRETRRSSEPIGDAVLLPIRVQR